MRTRFTIRIVVVLALASSFLRQAAPGAEPGEDTFQKGIQVFQSGDKASALKIFMSAAQAGNSKAAVQVGWCYEFAALYERGQSVPENWVEAASWYRSA